jgi:alkylation response protein AidB-like acyl-CoA dehydrogenase
MGRAGFLCTAVSPAYGGRGGDFLYSVIALEEMTRTNHYGLDAFLHSDIVVPYIASFGSEAQKKKYLPGCVSGDIITAVAMTEPDVGSDLSSMTTSAVEEGDEVVLNGTKTFLDKLIADHMAGKHIVAETSMAKYWNTEMANRVADRCLNLCGEFAVLEEACPIARTFRDVRVTTIFAGTNEVMRGIVAKSLGL